VGQGEGFETLNVARNVVRTGEFANPYTELPTGLTAHLPPAYPLLLALAMRVFGDPRFAPIVGFFTFGLHGLHAALLPVAARSLLGRELVGAGVLAALLPAMLVLPALEAALTAVLILVYVIAGSARWRGLLGGVILLLNPAALLILLPVEWLVPRRARLWCAAGAILVCSPWLIRNYVVFGQFPLFRDNLGLELYAANNDCAEDTLLRNILNGCHERTHPNASIEEAKRVRDLGEIRYNALRLADARGWIAAHPARFRTLTLERIRDFWWPPEDGHPVYAWSLRFIILLAIPGFYALWRENRRAGALALIVVAVYPLVYFVAQFSARFLYPVLWIYLLAAAAALSMVSMLVRPSKRWTGLPSRS
jgi:hypothetical protein